MPNINYEKQGPVAVLTLDRPEKLNALSRSMLTTLSETLNEIDNDQSVRCAILTGAGNRAFCVGTDIRELASLDDSQARQTAIRGKTVCDQIERLRVPVIAAVNGIAAGGGFELVLACHLRLAATNAEFSLPETKLGIIPGYGGTQRLTREIGKGRATELMLTHRSMLADEAQAVGLVNRVVEHTDLISDAEALAHEIAQLAPLAIQACLSAIYRGSDLSLAEGLAIETDLFAGLFATNDVKEGTRAFLEKRKPTFTGT